MAPSTIPSDYIRLAFMIDRFVPDYVDAYFGPPELEAQAKSGEPLPLSVLDDMAASLLKSVPVDASLSRNRRDFLEGQISAMRTTIRILDGRPPAFVEEVETLYGVRPGWVEEDAFEEAQRMLDDVIPGTAPLNLRVEEFRTRSRVPAAMGLSIFRHLLDELRDSTLRIIELQSDDVVELEVVKDKPWMANNKYLGGGISRIQLNEDFPMEIWNLLVTASHEAYPGHHTEYMTKEAKLFRGEGFLEYSIFPANNPSCLVSEGIAKNALTAIASNPKIYALLGDSYARAGLRKGEAEVAASYIQASRILERVSDNQLLMLHRDHASEEDVMAYGMRYAMTSREEENRYMRFFKDPLSRSYTYNYTLGSELVASYLDRAEDKSRAFVRLLTEPLTPAQIRAAN
jgi:hypothetical protein